MPSELDKITKIITENKKELTTLQRQHNDLKKTLKRIDQKISNVLDKIQEFEIVLDAAEVLESHIEEQEDKENEYDTEWNPEEDEDYDDDGGEYL